MLINFHTVAGKFTSDLQWTESEVLVLVDWKTDLKAVMDVVLVLGWLGLTQCLTETLLLCQGDDAA